MATLTRLPIAVLSLWMLTGPAAADGVWVTPPPFPQSGPGAQDMARECYRPRISDPNYVISVCTRFLGQTLMLGEPWPYAMRAVAYMHLGKFKLAVDDLNQAVALSPEHYKYLPDYYRYRCFARLNNSDAHAALQDCDKANELRPSDGSTFEFRGDVKYVLQDYPGAVADFDQALTIDPTNAGALYVRGLARERNGDQPGGQADVAAAKAKDPNIAKEYPTF